VEGVGLSDLSDGAIRVGMADVLAVEHAAGLTGGLAWAVLSVLLKPKLDCTPMPPWRNQFFGLVVKFCCRAPTLAIVYFTPSMKSSLVRVALGLPFEPNPIPQAFTLKPPNVAAVFGLPTVSATCVSTALPAVSRRTAVSVPAAEFQS